MSTYISEAWWWDQTMAQSVRNVMFYFCYNCAWIKTKKEIEPHCSDQCRLINEVVTFLYIFPPSNIARLQNDGLPVYYTLFWAWQPDASDTDMMSLFTRVSHSARWQILPSYWTSITMLHFAAGFLDPSLKHFRFVANLYDWDGVFTQVYHSSLVHWQSSMNNRK